jgi:hypothetical protein
MDTISFNPAKMQDRNRILRETQQSKKDFEKRKSFPPPISSTILRPRSLSDIYLTYLFLPIKRKRPLPPTPGEKALHKNRGHWKLISLRDISYQKIDYYRKTTNLSRK